MSKQIKLKIVTPEKLLLEEIVDQVSIPTTLGEITILPEHIPLVAILASGEIVAVVKGEYVPLAVSGGFVEVKKGRDGETEVAIMADFAEHAWELTDEKIKEAEARAQEIKKQMINKDSIDFEHFEAELERSLNRVKIADKWKTKKYRK